MAIRDDYDDPMTGNRRKAVEILEKIAEKLGNENIFDCRNGNTKWYDYEDMVVDILDK